MTNTVNITVRQMSKINAERTLLQLKISLQEHEKNMLKLTLLILQNGFKIQLLNDTSLKGSFLKN